MLSRGKGQGHEAWWGGESARGLGGDFCLLDSASLDAGWPGIPACIGAQHMILGWLRYNAIAVCPHFVAMPSPQLLPSRIDAGGAWF